MALAIIAFGLWPAKGDQAAAPADTAGAVALVWFATSGLPGEAPIVPFADGWPGVGGATLIGMGHSEAAPAGAISRFAAAGAGQREASEDRRARLGAAFLAEVMGPRPRRPAGLSLGAAGLRDLIALVEAGAAGYDAVVYGATIPPPRLPTQMTIAGIRDWVAASPGQNHAMGRYQIVPRTFEDLVRRLDLPDRTLFNVATQDLMADALIADAGYHEFRAGQLGRRAFMENLAVIWAGLPRSDGRSAYHGINGNRAGISWEAYVAAFATIFPP